MSARRSILVHAGLLPPNEDLKRRIVGAVGNCTIAHTEHISDTFDGRRLQLFARDYPHAILSIREDTSSVLATRLMRMLTGICGSVDLVLISANCRNGNYYQVVKDVFPQEESRTPRIAAVA